MRLKDNQKGFSLFELVIVIGIVGLLAGISLRMVGHLKFYNVEKAAQYVSDALTKQQMKSMSKENKPYLYIYELSGSIYVCLSEESTYNPTTMGTKGREIGAGMTVTYMAGGVEHTVGGTDILKIYYKKDGSFQDCPEKITLVSNSATRTIKLNKLTGKHVVTHE